MVEVQPDTSGWKGDSSAWIDGGLLNRRQLFGAAALAGAATPALAFGSAGTALAAPAERRLAQPAPAGRPMYQQDAQHTGRSPHAGPKRPLVQRSFDLASVGKPLDIQSSAVVGADGTIYLSTFSGSLFAFSDPGEGDTLDVVWSFQPEGSLSAHATPAVAADNTVYLAFGTRANPAAGTLYALRASASGAAQPDVVWTVDMGPGRTSSSPAIGPDGTIHALASNGRLVAVAPDGTVRWSIDVGPSLRTCPSLAADGTVFVASTDGKLYAVAPPPAGASEAAVRWTFDFGEHLGPTPFPTSGQGPGGQNGVGSSCTASVGPDGTIYIGANNSNFYAIAPDGRQKWLYEAQREVAGIWGDPALSADGKTVYFGANKGGVYALDTASGTLRWQYDIYGSVYSGLTLDREGRLYFGASVGHLFAVDTANGQRLFDHDAQGYPGIWTAPALRPDGTLLVADRRGHVLLFAA